MKMFTMSILVLLMIIPAFSGGQKEMAEQDQGASAMMMAPSPLMEFKDMEDAMMLAESKPTVLFFYATWCPTCQAAMKEINADTHKLSGINLLVVDYDNSDDLQKKYGITYQHTFVQIDTDGTALAKWSGGSVDEILMNVKKSGM